MAFDTYMMFKDQTGKYLSGESQATFDTKDTLGKDFTTGQAFEIDDFSFDIEQTLNIGSQSSGAGGGKITFNPFTITRKTDRISATLFQMACSGVAFKEVNLILKKASGGTSGGMTYLRYDFKLVAVKTLSWSGSDGDEAPKESVAFEYGAMQVTYQQQDTTGAAKGGAITTAWSRVTNNNSFADIVAK